MTLNPASPTRLTISNADVIQISGCSESTAGRKIKQIKDATGKKDYQEVSIKEYCTYFSLDYREVCEFLKILK